MNATMYIDKETNKEEKMDGKGTKLNIPWEYSHNVSVYDDWTDGVL